MKKQTHPAAMVAGIVLTVIGLVCLVIKALVGACLSPEGLLKEPFFLLPVGYAFLFVGLIVLAIAVWKGKKH